jgi:hypothetical protein
MNLSGSVITELARTWTFLHGTAAEAHLNHMAETLRRAGDYESAATFQRILDQISTARVKPTTTKPGDLSAASAAVLPTTNL